MSNEHWGDRFDWACLGRRSDEKIRVMRANGPNADRDLDFYATALKLNMKVFRPLVVIGKAINYMVAVAFLAAVAWSGWMLIEHQTEPVDFLDVKVLTSEAAPGSKIDVLFDINRRRVCQVDPDYAILGENNKKFTFAAQHIDIGGPLGHDPFIRSFDLPKDIVPGRARFRVGWTWVCPLNFVDLEFPRQSVVRDVPFTIRPAP